jgi:ADP-ribosylglycohydrolase
VWARFELDGKTDGFYRAATELRRIYAGDEARLEVLEFHVRPENTSPGGGSGYVVDTLRSARDVLSEPSYEDAMKAAIALGHDTDTTACVAGGIAGIRHGASAIPERWRVALRGENVVGPLLARLLSTASS